MTGKEQIIVDINQPATSMVTIGISCDPPLFGRLSHPGFAALKACLEQGLDAADLIQTTFISQEESLTRMSKFLQIGRICHILGPGPSETLGVHMFITLEMEGIIG